ncbi:MAG TPA: DoxX family protein [Segetibacter sp.]|jgi:putative oxidoreductase
MNFSLWLNRNKDVGVLLLRLFIGVWLSYGVLDNILHWDRMLEFEKFLTSFNFPFPLVCAVVSVYAQAVAAVMIIFGWKIRFAAILMIFNFLVALIVVHRSHPFDAMIPALSILFCCLLFLFQGAGRFSVDREKL